MNFLSERHLGSSVLLIVAMGVAGPLLAKNVEIVPSWSVQVLDETGKPVSGLRVEESWMFFGIEPKNAGRSTLKTNADGRVDFPAQAFQIAESRYLSEKATTMLNVHGSFGPTGSVWIQSPGYKSIQVSYDSDIYDAPGSKTRRSKGGLVTTVKFMPLDILDYIDQQKWEIVRATVTADSRMANFRSESGETPLMRLVHSQDFSGPVINLMKLLVDAGADINARDAGGATALHRAAAYCDLACMDFLLSRGANPNLRIDESNEYYGGFTPLDSALHAYEAREGHEGLAVGIKAPCVELLIAHGADVNGRASKGNTPLHVAMDYCEPAIVQLLLLKGANPLAKNSAGQTPLDSIASYRDDPRLHEIRELLMQGAAQKKPAQP